MTVKETEETWKNCHVADSSITEQNRTPSRVTITKQNRTPYRVTVLSHRGK